MIFKEEERIHIPPKWIAIWAIAFATIFILAITIGNHRQIDGFFIRNEVGLDTVYLENYSIGNHCTNWDTIWLSGLVELVENKQNFDQWNHSYKHCKPNEHQIYHIDCPYYMFKKPNNDTIVVIKDGYVLKFKLPNSENQGRDFPPKSFSEFKENVGKAYTERYE